MKRFLVLAALMMLVCAPVWAQVTDDTHCPQQTITTSWHGLSGLYVIPTARMIGRRNLAVGFNESKHTEFVEGEKFTDRQIRGVLTYGITDWMEITGTYFNDTYTVPPGVEPQLHNQTFSTFGVKFRLLLEDPQYWFPEVSIGFRDLTNDTADVGPLHNVGNGTKAFLLLSKRMLKNPCTGRFMDVHLGVTYDHNQFAGIGGFELTLAPNASLIAEFVWDSPYLNFRRFGENGSSGKYLFNTGLRIYPELVHGLALDLGFVGDGEFEFSFGASYVMNL